MVGQPSWCSFWLIPDVEPSKFTTYHMFEDTSTSSPGTLKENNLSIPLFQSAEWKVRAEVGEEVREESAEESEVLWKGTAHHLSGNKHRKKNS